MAITANMSNACVLMKISTRFALALPQMPYKPRHLNNLNDILNGDSKAMELKILEAQTKNKDDQQ